ncbi:MAG TPA: methionine biosynthesis protein MetW [bacterium]|nr:methionine biosynthesis protein MetW [bacterium]
MLNSGVKNFEDKRWTTKGQTLEFRHTQTAEMVKSGTVLDLGCGDGLFMELLKEKNIAAFGLDISDVAVNICQEKKLATQVFDFTSNELPYQERSFDYVVMLDVLEHLYQPEKLLAEAARVAKEYIVFSVPNFNSLPARWQVLKGQVPLNNKPNKGHVYWFNYEVISSMLRASGLVIVDFKKHTFWENKILLGGVMKFLLKMWPSLLALSFVIKAKKI